MSAHDKRTVIYSKYAKEPYEGKWPWSNERVVIYPARGRPIGPQSTVGHWKPINTKSLVGRWTRFCWWVSRHLGGRSVFGKADHS